MALYKAKDEAIHRFQLMAKGYHYFQLIFLKKNKRTF